ncbi:MAG: reductive dehalogenase [Candidatus Hodarchaeales archaeon]
MTAEDRTKKLEKEFYRGKVPFAIDESVYERFTERKTIFSRVVWDETYKAFNRSISERAPKRVGKKGYSRIGYAARDAAWTVHDKHRIMRSVSMESTPTDLISNLPRYESADTKANSKMVKHMAKIFGAYDAGICQLDNDLKFIYTHDRQGNPVQVPESVKYAIVMLVEMDQDALGTSPALPASITTGHGYSTMSFLTMIMSQFLQNLGYTAIEAGNDIGLSVPLAVKAGLGQFGRNGLLIHPRIGQRVRICKVLTDFPLLADEPIDFGVTGFCKVCMKCATHCPSQSIPYDKNPTWESPWGTPSNNNGTLKWYVNVDSCYNYWVANSSECSTCLRVCPFTRPDRLISYIPRFFIKHMPFMNKLWIIIEDFMGIWPWRSGKQKDPQKFWSARKYLNRKLK